MDGVLVVWNIGFNEQKKLIHAVVKTVDLPADQTGGGHPVSLYYMAPYGPHDSLALGLSSNSVLEVKLNTSELCLLITAHNGVLEACASHPFKPFYVTAGREKMVRVWDASARGLLCRARIHAPASCCSWSPDGTTIVIGTIQGDFAVLVVGSDGGARSGLQSIMVKQLLHSGVNNLSSKTEMKKKERLSKSKKEMTPLQRKMRALRGAMSDSPTGQKPFKRHEEVQDIKFSPDGTKLAIASRDNNIYIYRVDQEEQEYHIIGVCRGHSSYVTHIDWSEDSTSLQSNDGSYELLYWDANTAKQVRCC
jgi:WD40 repeat protein